MKKTGRTGRTGRNETCPCKSGKKFKKCCEKQVMEQQRVMNDYVNSDNQKSSEKVVTVMNRFRKDYDSYLIRDISHLLTQQNYKQVQIANFNHKTVMIAERNELNDEVFKSRAPDSTDIIVLYNGAYRCFNFNDLELAMTHIDKMIN